LGQGRGNAKAYLRENPDVARSIEKKVYVAVGMDTGSGAPVIAAVDPAEGEVVEPVGPVDDETEVPVAPVPESPQEQAA